MFLDSSVKYHAGKYHRPRNISLMMVLHFTYLSGAMRKSTIWRAITQAGAAQRNEPCADCQKRDKWRCERAIYRFVEE